MGLLDDLLSETFKTDKDGRRIFYPGGPLYRGYIIPFEEDFKRFRKRLKVFIVPYFICGFAMIPLIGRLRDPKGAFLFFYYMAPYYLWFYYQCLHLKRSDEGLTFSERIAKQAGEVPLYFLWVSEIISIAFIVAGIYIITVDWRNLLYLFAAIGTVFFFGYRVFIGAKMLIAKNRKGNRDS